RLALGELGHHCGCGEPLGHGLVDPADEDLRIESSGAQHPEPGRGRGGEDEAHARQWSHLSYDHLTVDGCPNVGEKRMAWDFSTDPEFQKKLDWVEQLCKEKIEPLDYVFPYAIRSQNPKVKALAREIQD